MRISVNLDTSQSQLAFKTLKEKAPRLIVHALNRAAGTGRTHGARLVSKDMRLPVNEVRDRIDIREATQQRQQADITASAKRIPVMAFGARGPEPSRGQGRGVTARTPAKRYPRAFIARMKSGHRGVFERKGKARLPIAELFGSSIYHVFGKHQAAVAHIAQVQLEKNLAHNFKFFTQGG